MQELIDQLIDVLKEYVQKEYKNLFNAYNSINSIGIAYKITQGDKKNELCIRFSVEKKRCPTDLAKLKIKPIPDILNYLGWKLITDIVERTFPNIQNAKVVTNNRKNKLNPICPGISVSNDTSGAGTIGLIVKDNITNKPMILSNWHVLKSINGSDGNTIKQPGVADYNQQPSKSVLGNLDRNYLGEEGDCAIGEFDKTKRGFVTKIYDLNISPKSILQNTKIEAGLNVIKSGRTTAITYGKVSAIDVKVLFNYQGNIGKVILNTFEIEPNYGDDKLKKGNPIVDYGDSGSSWLVDEESRNDVVAGLHFHHSDGADSDGNIVRYANSCYIDAVFKVLNIDLYP